MSGNLERWLPSPSYPAYEVSDHGRVRRVAPGCGARVGRVLASHVKANGYRYVTIYQRCVRLHILVADAFLGPIPPGGEVHHGPGGRADASVANLSVCPSRLAHRELHRRVRTDLRRHGEPNPLVACACGCGTPLRRYDGEGRPRRYVYGHNVSRRVAA